MKSMLHAGERLRPSARTLWELKHKAGRLPVEAKSGLYLHALREAEKCLEAADRRRESVKDMASLRKYQDEVRRAFFDCLGFVPEETPDAFRRARMVARVEKSGFTVEKILLEPREGSYASANVYVPACARPPYPAVLITVGHDDRGKADPEYQYLAQRLAHSGILCLVLDPVGQGERFEHYDAKADFQPMQGCSGEHDLLDWKAKLLGRSLAGYFIQDGLCALDYLSGRPDVDSKRIGLTGHSGGGTQVSLLMMAAGERFKCAAPCAYITDNRAMLECGVDPDNEMLWPGSIASGLDYIDFVAGMAPNPVLLLTDRQDFFPREGTKRTLEKAKALWKNCFSSCTVEMATAENGHGYPAPLAQEAARFFEKNLAASPASGEDCFRFEPLDAQVLSCTASGQMLKQFPDMRTLHDELVKECLRMCQMRSTLPLQKRIDGFKRLLHLDDSSPSPEPRVYDEGICGEYQYRCMLWRTPDGLINSGLLLRAWQLGDAPLPTLIALWPEGTTRIPEYSSRLHRMVLNGWQVLVMDVTASGALLPSALASTDMYMSWSTMYILNAYLMQLGDSLFSLRVREIASALNMLKGFEEADSDNISFYALGEMSRCAEVASLLTNTKIYSDGDFESWEEIVCEPFHDQTNTFALALPGALRYFDSDEISRLVHDTLKLDDPALTKA